MNLSAFNTTNSYAENDIAQFTTALSLIHIFTTTFDPKVVVIDPITNFASVGSHSEVKSMVTRLIDMLKGRQITAMFTSLTPGDSSAELSEVGVSSQMDSWRCV